MTFNSYYLLQKLYSIIAFLTTIKLKEMIEVQQILQLTLKIWVQF